MTVILVNRTGALGDVVLTTPIVRRLKRENPDSEIHVQTTYPDVFRHSPHVARCWSPNDRPDYDQLIELDLVYERSPLVHVVDAYMWEAFGDAIMIEPDEKRQELFYGKLRRPRNTTPMVAVHAARAGWRSRTLPEKTWLEVCRLLKAASVRPLLVGAMRDELRGSGHMGFHNSDILAQAAAIARCDCFVGSDTGLLHVAGATDTPIVGVFTSVDPAWRLPYRENCAAVVPDLPCVFCHGRQPAPATTESCEIDDRVACVRAVRPETIVQAVLDMLEKTR